MKMTLEEKVEKECDRLAALLVKDHDKGPEDLSECWGRLQALSTYRMAICSERMDSHLKRMDQMVQPKVVVEEQSEASRKAIARIVARWEERDARAEKKVASRAKKKK